jgi:hypothetical protein
MVKEELNQEEKFFEKAVVTERFIKKYKNMIIGAVGVIILGVGANIIYTINNENRIISANEALSSLMQNSTDIKAKEELKKLSPSLYDAWLYSNAIANKDMKALSELKNSKTLIISDLAQYESANDIKSLESYSLKQDAIYKDLAVIQSAVLLMDKNKTDEAHEKLKQISADSSLNNVSNALSHYGVK